MITLHVPMTPAVGDRRRAARRAPRGDAASSLWMPCATGDAMDVLADLAASLAPGEDIEFALERGGLPPARA